MLCSKNGLRVLPFELTCAHQRAPKGRECARIPVRSLFFLPCAKKFARSRYPCSKNGPACRIIGGGPMNCRCGRARPQPAVRADQPLPGESHPNHCRCGPVQQSAVQNFRRPLSKNWSSGGTRATKTEKRKLTIKEARKKLLRAELDSRITQEEVVQRAIKSVEEEGMIFLDEIDKIVSPKGSYGPDASSEGVQRDLLPIIEGTTVSTK